MLRKVFVFNPHKRATAGELMQSRYFDELRREVSEGIGRYPLPTGLFEGTLYPMQTSNDFSYSTSNNNIIMLK